MIHSDVVAIPTPPRKSANSIAAKTAGRTFGDNLSPARNGLPEAADSSIVDGDRFVGTSPAARQVRRMIGRLAKTSVTTLIHGETGTGKEIVALLLHRNSPRAGGPLVPVNCAAIPEAMIEGELFGYEKGAFSSAVRSYPGKFGLADGGTLFLDEIGELSLAAQAKILRAIETKEVFPLGAMTPRRCDARIIAATHRDLEAEVAAGRFRADLFFRLAVVRMTIAPLTERRSDIEAIARHLLEALAVEMGCTVPALDAATVAALRDRDWPGNVRELRNALEHAMVVAEDVAVLRADDLPRPCATSCAVCDSLAEPEPSVSTADIVAAIRACGGQKARAARMLHMSRTTLYRRLRRIGIDPASV